jgi:hypothetical protein
MAGSVVGMRTQNLRSHVSAALVALACGAGCASAVAPGNVADATDVAVSRAVDARDVVTYCDAGLLDAPDVIIPDGAMPFGAIHVSMNTQMSRVNSSASAEFYFIGFVMDSCCTATNVGPCVVKHCRCPSSLPAGSNVGANAGVVSITGLLGGPITLTPSLPDEQYSTVVESTPLFAGGESVTFQAAGAPGGVPAFTRTLAAPSVITETSPDLSSPAATISRASNLVVSWSGGGVGSVVASMRGVDFTAADWLVAVACTFPSSDGTGTVPAAALAPIPAGSGGFSLVATDAATVDAGAFVVAVDVSQTAYSASVAYE